MNADPGVVKKLDLKPGDTMVVQVDVGSMPPGRQNEYFARVARMWRDVITDTSINIAVIPKSTAITIISGGATGASTHTGNISGNPKDAYDHAMGIVP